MTANNNNIDLTTVPIRALRAELKRREVVAQEREHAAHMRNAIAAGYLCGLCGECPRCEEDDLL